MHGYPILPALFVVFCMVLVVVTIVESPRNAIFGLVLMVSGLPFYLFWDRQSKTAEK
jgi:APA family basic amino acid/polyamine antiporter